MNILIAGINGFVGKHLAREAIGQGDVVIGVGQDESLDSSLPSDIKYYKADLTLPQEVEGLPLRTIDAVINLAGLADVGASFKNPEAYMKINVEAHTVLCEALIKLGSKARVLCVSTGAVYDNSRQMPVNEQSELLAPGEGSPYSHSKINMEKAVLEFKDRLDVIVARPFNHFGPGQLPGFLVPQIFSNIKESQKSGLDTITLGPIDKARDFTDVRDVVRAYLALIHTENLGENRVFNVCGGQPVLSADILSMIQGILGTNLTYILDETKVRPHDPGIIFGDNSRLVKTTSWQRKYSLQETLEDIAASF